MHVRRAGLRRSPRWDRSHGKRRAPPQALPLITTTALLPLPGRPFAADPGTVGEEDLPAITPCSMARPQSAAQPVYAPPYFDAHDCPDLAGRYV